MAATHAVTDEHPLKGLSLVETTELARLSTAPGAANDERWIELYLKHEAAKLMDQMQSSLVQTDHP
jgi:hypothetical protein